MRTVLRFLLFSLIFFPLLSYSQDFVFRFTNPAFGGETFNYQLLPSSADAQNTFKEEIETQIPDYHTDPLVDFENSLNRQILNQLSRKLIDNWFGEEDLGEGVYVFGNYQIEIGELDGGLNVIIFDLNSGDQSTIFVPFY